MNFTQKQIYEILEQVVCKEEGLEQLLKMSMEVLMKTEREEHNDMFSDLSNGYRPRKTFGNGKILELQVPRTRNGNFYPIILGLLRNQEEEAKKIAFKLYGAGLTTEQVGELFGDIYGQTYSTSQISRMFDYAREEVQRWQERKLEVYYPIVFIDATFIPTRREDNVSKEAYYTILAVKTDFTREVLAVINNPTEGSSFWNNIFELLKERGVQEIGLVVTDALKGIETVIHKQFDMAEIQFCSVHLQRECLKIVKPIHKAELSMDFREVFRTDDRNDTKLQGIQRWKTFCLKWSKYYSNFNKKAENERYEYYFTYLKYNYQIRNMIYSTNWIERLNRDYKRTTRMRGALPNIESTILLLSNVAMTRKAYEYKIIRFKEETEKFRWDD